VNSPAAVALLNHVWQSTLFAVLVGCLTLLLRRNGARVRCLLWLSASVKFLVPFALLTAVGTRIPWPLGPLRGMQTALLSAAGQTLAHMTPFDAASPMAPPKLAHAAHQGAFMVVLGLIWAIGALVAIIHWYVRWRTVRRALRESVHTELPFLIPVRSSASQLEPGVVGLLRPVLLLPEGLERRLAPAELRAVLAHEHCHVVWRDNLAATVHMLVEAIFWFHPLIWWLGARIVDERERACDEAVLAEGHSPGTYAEGILKVCEHYLGSGLACVAGIGGANLIPRIEAIMKNGAVERLGVVRRLVITLAACATIALPIAIGLGASPRASAQAAVALAAPAAEGGQPALLHINFDNADIQRIALAVATATHRTLIIDPRVRATGISIHSTQPLTPNQFYQAFLVILQRHHLTAVPANGAIRIQPDEGAHSSLTPAAKETAVSLGERPATLYLGPPRPWELRDEVWLAMPDPPAPSEPRD
jgi:beta-lactamase regulating signal transducer with metallopeptidase domain